jgi:hypothetical protein
LSSFPLCHLSLKYAFSLCFLFIYH